MAQCQLVGALRQAERHRGRAEPLAVVGAHEVLEAVAGRDEEVLRRDEAGREVELALRDPAQAHHGLAAPEREAGRVALDEQAADPLGAGPPAEAREDEVEPRRAGARDPALVAGEPVAAGRLLGARLEVGRRRARGGLADRDRRLVALEHPREVPALLRLGAVGGEGADDAEAPLDDDPPGDPARPRA